MGFSLSDVVAPFVDPIGSLESLLGKGGAVDDALRGIDKAADRGLRYIDDKILGGDAADAAMEAAATQEAAAQQASSLFDPFQAIGQQGLDASSILTDPMAQFNFLKSNPLFNLGLESLNKQTMKSAAASGRIGATDTNQQLMNNAILAANPLLSRQQTNVTNLLNLGQGIAGQQGNLLTGGAAARAGGLVGAENARQAGMQNLLGFGGAVAPSAIKALTEDEQ